MKTALISLAILYSLSISAQNIEISNLETKKKEILNQISNLNDSIKKIDVQISALKSKETQKLIANSKLTAIVQKGAKLRENADPMGKLICTLQENKLVTIIDYNLDYFGVCTDSICGYMSDIWIKKDDNILNFIKTKKAEEEEIKRLENEQKLKAQKAEWAELEKKYIKQYGEKTYNKLKAGFYWIGMNKEMATISLGSPNSVNRTVGSWGVHEQWVYSNLYLYFENGILTSYQD
jgi:hypothetical protein